MISEQLARLRRQFAKQYDTFNTIELSRSALLNNFDLYKQRQLDHDIIPVLKSNAYGHGLTEVTEILKARKFPYIAVDGYFEVLTIRSVSKQPVLVMGTIKPENYKKLRFGQNAFVVQDTPSIEALGELAWPVKIHLEINTGMNRYGIDPKKLFQHLNMVERYPQLRLEGVMSHLSDADALKPDRTAAQAKIFDKAVKLIHAAGFAPRYVHLGQSAGALTARSTYANTYRIGKGLYGINPFAPDHPAYPQLQPLQPVLVLKSTIAKINQLSKGDRVSYDGIFRAPHDMKIGVLPLGYYEGVRRIFSNKGFVAWQDKYLRIVGNVCMNHTMINVEGTDAKVGDEVTIVSAHPGKKNSVKNICEKFGLLDYEFMVGLAPTIRRIVVD